MAHEPAIPCRSVPIHAISVALRAVAHGAAGAHEDGEEVGEEERREDDERAQPVRLVSKEARVRVDPAVNLDPKQLGRRVQRGARQAHRAAEQPDCRARARLLLLLPVQVVHEDYHAREPLQLPLDARGPPHRRNAHHRRAARHLALAPVTLAPAQRRQRLLPRLLVLHAARQLRGLRWRQPRQRPQPPARLVHAHLALDARCGGDGFLVVHVLLAHAEHLLVHLDALVRLAHEHRLDRDQREQHRVADGEEGEVRQVSSLR
mmetsp:Transcript_18037/g.41358  ORF Transcript_18037/g.41358 Transcript_18037/m.41358 type:complete len:262 (+) Transcript_18037:70-855(+)